MLMESRTLSSFDRAYTIERLKRQARSMRLESARATSVLAAQLRDLAATFEAEAEALEFKAGERSLA
ncbi:MAG TPA: hypothetical protein VG328_10615 [Stellaceae bacterium]|jgi:hypothetical protein|nr:hypothetical protein [Stellaceae bacterium]